jgi:hypothetical protein
MQIPATLTDRYKYLSAKGTHAIVPKAIGRAGTKDMTRIMLQSAKNLFFLKNQKIFSIQKAKKTIE